MRGVLTIYIGVPREHEEVFGELLMSLSYWGQTKFGGVTALQSLVCCSANKYTTTNNS